MRSLATHSETPRGVKRALFALACLVASVGSSPSYAKAPKGRYTIANGEVTDTKTKLIWLQALNPGAFTFDEAATVCTKLGGGWRTPNVRELFSLVDESVTSPAIDTDAFPDTPQFDMWSSTPVAGDVKYGWAVNFAIGSVDNVTKVTARQVRCVR